MAKFHWTDDKIVWTPMMKQSYIMGIISLTALVAGAAITWQSQTYTEGYGYPDTIVPGLSFIILGMFVAYQERRMRVQHLRKIVEALRVKENAAKIAMNALYGKNGN